MKKFFYGKDGNVTFAVAIFVTLFFIFMLFFFMVISKNMLNVVLHEAKSDLYLINRNAIFAIEHGMMGDDIEGIDEEELKEVIEKGIMNTWGLDRKLKNGEGIIKEAKILNIDVLEAGEIDNVSGKIVTDYVVHTEIKLKIIPIIFKTFIGGKYEFYLHEDLKIEKIEL